VGRVASVGGTLSRLALCAFALARHPEDARSFLSELAWGFGMFAAGLAALTLVAWVGSAIADRVRPRVAPEPEVEPVTRLGLRLLAAEVALTGLLAFLWAADGHLALAWWYGALLAVSTAAALATRVGVIRRVGPPRP
jgi:hypothetical protein